MLPVNSKSLFHSICRVWEKLDNDEIDTSKASAFAKLAGQANNYLNYELKRAVIMSNQQYAEHHRNIELKEFDSLPQ